MKTFPTVEEYLEVISGKRELNGNPQNSLFGIYEFLPILNLARYDVNFLDSVTDQTMSGQPLTDRQAELAIKIILKYRKQLNTRGIETFPEHQAVYRKPLRRIDRSKSLRLQDNKIIMRFPYEQEMINTIRNMAKESQGRVAFDRANKYWVGALTEYNLNWITEFARAHEFDISPDIEQLMNLIIEQETKSWNICLHRSSSGLSITNASQNLVEWIDQHGGFDQSRLLQLVDWAPCFGYQVESQLFREAEQLAGHRCAPMLGKREYEINQVEIGEAVSRVLEYAQLVDRWPVVVYDPSAEFDVYRKRFPDDQTLTLVNRREDIQPDHRLILTNRSLKQLDRIPLLISHVGLLAGQDKKIMTNAAEKIIYLNCYRLGT